MASETTLFKKRIVILNKIANALGEDDISYSLQALSERVCTIGNLNSGGKFEWIDSILVKVSHIIIILKNKSLHSLYIITVP